MLNIPLRHLKRCSIYAAIAVCLPSLAFAQESTPAQTTDAKTLDTVNVTGTRIKKAELETQVPVQVLTRDDLERTGLTSIGDVVQNLTSSGSSLNSRANRSGNSGFSPNGDGVGAGSAQVDLRNLGAKRVLVLVDGMRWVSESSASGVGAAVDLNTIPLAIVERVEVLQDGASSLYGSDAIAGVVNIITRRDFDGAQISVNAGQYTEGDGFSHGVDLAWGFNTDRSNLFLGLSYFDQEPVFSSDRKQSSEPTPGLGIAAGSSASINGRFLFLDTPSALCPDGVCDITTPVGSSFPNGVNYPNDFKPFESQDRFNFALYNMLVTPSKRMGGFGQYRFHFNDNVSAYAKVLVNRRESVNQAGPEPIFLGPDGATGNPYADNITISRLNPYNPFGIDLISSGPGANLIMVGRRPVEGGPRRFEQKVDTRYLAAGIEGGFDVGNRAWSWDVNVSHGENEAEQTNFGSYNIYNINLALGDPAACAAVAGCVPLNIFGGVGTITPDMLRWIQPIVRDRSEQTLSNVTANITGDLFDMWAGPVSMAAGYEYRKVEGSYTPDPLNYVRMPDGTVENHYNGVPSLPTSGKYDVNEVYVELNVPLMKDTAFGKSLDLSLAGRYSDYSTFGGQFTPKYGLRWQVADELLFRATYAEGFRSPTIGELYGSASRADLQITDPCLISVSGEPPTGNPANCAALGVPAGAAQRDNQISVVTGGNQNLKPETSRSFTAGMVFSPELRAEEHKLDFELTYYRYSLEGAIQAISAQTQLNLCVETLDPTYCNGIERSSVGGISNFENALTNLGSIKTDGWDANIFWTLPESSAGQFKIAWQNTLVTRYEAVGAAGQRQPERIGWAVGDPTTAIPDWTSTLAVDWKKGNWFANWTMRYISSMMEECGAGAESPYCDQATGLNELGDTLYNDAQLGYRFNVLKGLQVVAGANNLFDRDPPICLSCSLNGYDATTYDIPGGRFVYLRADLKF